MPLPVIKSPPKQLLAPKVVNTSDIPPKAKRVVPKGADPFLDQPLEIKDLKGSVVFEGSPRQWRQWAHQRTVNERIAAGLPPTAKADVTRKKSRK